MWSANFLLPWGQALPVQTCGAVLPTCKLKLRRGPKIVLPKSNHYTRHSKSNQKKVQVSMCISIRPLACCSQVAGHLRLWWPLHENSMYVCMFDYVAAFSVNVDQSDVYTPV